MLSRIGKLIGDYREQIGLAFVAISVFWLMGVAGTDDYNSARHIFTPVLPLMIKTTIGLLGMWGGVRILTGGEQK